MIELDMRSAQNALRLKRALQAEELPFNKLRFALNRAPKFTDLNGKSRVKRMGESLGISIDLQLPDGGKPVMQSGDHGLPLANSAAKNPLRREIAKLAKSLHSLGQQRRRSRVTTYQRGTCRVFKIQKTVRCTARENAGTDCRAGSARAAEAPATTAAVARRKPQKKPAEPVAGSDRDRKRKERLGEIKIELHRELLENLNLAALENAGEAELRAEISAIASEVLETRNIVLNREDRSQLNKELYDEVTGLGPLETLAAGRYGQRYSGERPPTDFRGTRR